MANTVVPDSSAAAACITAFTGNVTETDGPITRLQVLGFEVQVYNNLNNRDVDDKIRAAAAADHSDADCFLLVFLSHGEDHYVYTYDGKISIKDITAKFKGNKCKSLACRGSQFDDSVTACDGDFMLNDVVVDTGAVYTLPAGADFIMCYSVAEGYHSFRDTDSGSWYIQDLCELLQWYGESLEFTHLLTLVNRKVSMRTVKASSNKNALDKKQVPCFASMLTKKIYFCPKK